MAVTGLIRRTLWLLLLGLAGGAAYQWWRERDTPGPERAPEWPPIDVTSSNAATDAGAEVPADEPTDTPETPSPATDAPAASSSVVNALVDAPEARSAGGDGSTWVEPDADGACPLTHPIKANDNSGIFHVPGGRFYDRTKAERCYVDADAAAADGYRRAKS